MSADDTIATPGPVGGFNPGGRLPAPLAPSATDEAATVFWDARATGRLGSLVLAAGPLLMLGARLKRSLTHDDVAGLRERVLREIEAFEKRIVPLGLAPRSVRAARYALCATIDDVVLNTPWGSRSLWTRSSMVGSLFSETWSGDRFFDLLAQLKRDPAIHLDLLELLYYCLSLGFEGRLRLDPRGPAALSSLREDLHRLIRAGRGGFERDLSPHWRGAPVERGLPATMPAWLIGLGATAVLALIYSGLLFTLNARSDAVFGELSRLPPRHAISLARAAPPPPPPVLTASASEEIQRFLEPEIRAGLVTVAETMQSISVTIRGAGIFASGRAQVEGGFEPLFQRIGQALNGQPGGVLILGHTDSVPIRSVAFPSNFHLSQARAEAAARIIAARMREPDRLRSQGLGDTAPVATNDTEEGRRRNRRIEIVIGKPA